MAVARCDRHNLERLGYACIDTGNQSRGVTGLVTVYLDTEVRRARTFLNHAHDVLIRIVGPSLVPEPVVRQSLYLVGIITTDDGIDRDLIRSGVFLLVADTFHGDDIILIRHQHTRIVAHHDLIVLQSDMRILTLHRDRSDRSLQVRHHQRDGGRLRVGRGGLTILLTGDGKQTVRELQIWGDTDRHLFLPDGQLLMACVAWFYGGVVGYVDQRQLLFETHGINLCLGVPLRHRGILLMSALVYDTTPVASIVRNHVVIVTATLAVGIQRNVYPEATEDGLSDGAVGGHPLELLCGHLPSLRTHRSHHLIGQAPRVDTLVHLNARGLGRSRLNHNHVLLIHTGTMAELYQLVADTRQVAARIGMGSVGTRVHHELHIVVEFAIVETRLAYGCHQSPVVGVRYLMATIEVHATVHVGIVESHIVVIRLPTTDMFHLFVDVERLTASLCAHRPVEHRTGRTVIGIEVTADAAHGCYLLIGELTRQTLALTEETLCERLREQSHQPCAERPRHVIVVITEQGVLCVVPLYLEDLTRCGRHAEVTTDGGELTDLQLIKESLFADGQVVEGSG